MNNNQLQAEQAKKAMLEKTEATVRQRQAEMERAGQERAAQATLQATQQAAQHATHVQGFEKMKANLEAYSEQRKAPGADVQNNSENKADEQKKADIAKSDDRKADDIAKADERKADERKAESIQKEARKSPEYIDNGASDHPGLTSADRELMQRRDAERKRTEQSEVAKDTAAKPEAEKSIAAVSTQKPEQKPEAQKAEQKAEQKPEIAIDRDAQMAKRQEAQAALKKREAIFKASPKESIAQMKAHLKEAHEQKRQLTSDEKSMQWALDRSKIGQANAAECKAAGNDQLPTVTRATAESVQEKLRTLEAERSQAKTKQVEEIKVHGM